ncbi:MAG: cupin domain-containing protein [Halomonas sp.]|uniref:cupin domain-containing protein n=1 Tax=Halomonas sp. TaxID=1486246 RepID=UPI003F906A2D
MDMLPPIVHIHNETEQAALRWSVERMMKELHDSEPGGFLIAQHLAHMMLVQALRLHMVEGVMNDGGWLVGVANKHLGPAINAIHADPAHRWTLQSLAGDRLENSQDPVSVISLSLGYESESTFSTAFKRVMGVSPHQYSRDANPA